MEAQLKEKLDLLIKPDPKGFEGHHNPQRLWAIWLWLSQPKDPYPYSYYDQLYLMLLKYETPERAERLDKFEYAYNQAAEHARVVARGVYHYLAELWKMRADAGTYEGLRTLECVVNARKGGHPEAWNLLERDGVFTEQEEGAYNEYQKADGSIGITYAGKNKDFYKAELREDIMRVNIRLKLFKESTEGILKYFAEIVPADYLEPFGNYEGLLPPQLLEHISSMREGFLREANIDAKEYNLLPYDQVKTDGRAVNKQYRYFKQAVETRWKRCKQ